MSAGSGIIHQEMPKVDHHRLGGFQLWVNMPKAQKMSDPRYQEVKSARISEIEPARGVRMRVVAGNIGGNRGAGQGIGIDPEYTDVSLESPTDFVHPVKRGHHALRALVQGRA